VGRARRLASLERRYGDRLGRRCRFGLCNVFFQVGKLKLKLVEQRATLARLSERLPRGGLVQYMFCDSQYLRRDK
jgi:hypothetical protein